MRHSIFLMSCFALIAHTAVSQLTLVPRAGVENSRTLVSINDNKYFSPGSSIFAPQAGIRLDYKFKKAHGIFAGVSTSNTIKAFNFSDPETSFTNSTASRSGTQLRLEAGYQLNTKPVFLKKAATQKKSAEQKQKNCGKKEDGSMKQKCGSYVQRSSCGDKSKAEKANRLVQKARTSVSFLPYIGAAFNPSVKNNFTNKSQGLQTSYTYNAGNMNTAFITGMGFDFSKGEKKLVRINLQYLKGIGNLDNATLTTQAGNKSVVTNFASRTSAWSLSAGLPISFAKKPAVKNKTSEKKHLQKIKHCEQIRYRCGGVRI